MIEDVFEGSQHLRRVEVKWQEMEKATGLLARQRKQAVKERNHAKNRR